MTGTSMSIADSFSIAKATQMPMNREKIHNLQCIYTVEFYVAEKNKEHGTES